MQFVTAHIITTLPLHNMNRDQTGLPKSQFDGGIQRGRLSSQSLKRAARVSFLSTYPQASVRTRDGATVTFQYAAEYAAETGLPFDVAAGRATIASVINGFAKKETVKNDKKGKNAPAKTKPDTATAVDPETTAGVEQGDNVLFFSQAELRTLAQATVTKQQDGTEVTAKDCILDASSPSLDVAAFGRMFAAAHDIGTHAAVAVSHASTTHPFMLTADYFTAFDDRQNAVGHIGMAYYTSGTYYRTFTVDAAQLGRSWSRSAAPEARAELTALIRALLRALPTGRQANSNADTAPALILVESQKTRTAYDFDEPVDADGHGYKKPTIAALAAKRRTAVTFDPTNYGPAAVAGETFDNDFAEAADLVTLDEIIGFIVDQIVAYIPQAV